MTNSSKKTSGGAKKAAKTTSVKSAPVKAAKKAVAAKTPAAVQAAPEPKAAAKAPAKRAPAKRNGAKSTTVTVEADVGFGNQLFIRGEGAGLNWESGVPMNCSEASRWEWSTKAAKEKVSFKVLINDQIWSQGENFEVAPGESQVIHPEF